MTWIAVAVVGGSLVSGLMSSNAQQSAADTAANAQTQSAQMGIDEQRRQFDKIQALLAPYANAGPGALKSQQDLSGANGPQAQQAAITALQQTPAFTSQLKVGENRILANASATGGLRGGNTQAALGYFAPQLLAQTINDQYARLGGITSIGENAATMTGNAGMQTGQNIAGLYGQQGSAQAGAALSGGAAQSRLYNSFTSALGQYTGMGGTFGGGLPQPGAVQAQFAQTPAGQAGFGTGAAYGNQDYGMYF